MIEQASNFNYIVIWGMSSQNNYFRNKNINKKNTINKIRPKSEWVIVVWHQLSNFPAISWREQGNFQWDDDDVRFVLDQYA
jgi:hypothetical protein